MIPTAAEQALNSDPHTTRLRVRNLRVNVKSGTDEWGVVRGVSMDLGAGRILGLVGESGSGKTMTSRAILQLLDQSAEISGSVTLDGTELIGLRSAALRRIRGLQLTLVAQDPMTSLDPLQRIGRQVSESLLLHRLARRREAWEIAVSQLDSVGMADPPRDARLYPHQCSGGMRQRALIASALVASPAVVIADEPTTALDVTRQAQVLSLLRRLTDESGAAVLLISHDLAAISEIADRVAVMYAGRIVEIGDKDEVLQRPRHPYTMALLAAVPPRPEANTARRLHPVAGEVPSMKRLGAGCAFASRCPLASSRCLEDDPNLEKVSELGDHEAACWHLDETTPKHGPAFEQREQGAMSPVHLSAVSANPPQELERKPVPVEPLLAVEGLHCTYRNSGRKGHKAVIDVSLSIAPGETLGIVGESGSGKSTVARAILQLIRPNAGSIRFEGDNLATADPSRLRMFRERVQPVFQDPYSSLNPRWSVDKIISEPLAIRGVSREQQHSVVKRLLPSVGLTHEYADVLPHALSGGQRQRVAIARALATDPDLLIADEPLSSLDVSVQAQVLNVLLDLRESMGLAIIFISHDIRVVEYLCDRVVVMHRGRVVEAGPTIEVCRAPKHPYTTELIASVPELGDGRQSVGPGLQGKKALEVQPDIPRGSSLRGAK